MTPFHKQKSTNTATTLNHCESSHMLRNIDNLPGNCPEFSTWATICCQPGYYCTLCLNITLEKTMQCCGPCFETKKVVGNVGIFIDDRWQIYSLMSALELKLQIQVGIRLRIWIQSIRFWMMQAEGRESILLLLYSMLPSSHSIDRAHCKRLINPKHFFDPRTLCCFHSITRFFEWQ